MCIPFYRIKQCQITEKEVCYNLNCRINLSHLTEKYYSKLPNIRFFDYLCKSKYFNLWMVTDIE